MWKKIVEISVNSKPITLKKKLKHDQRMNNCSMPAKLQTSKRDDTWFIDSDCSNHMTGDENIFRCIDTSVKSRVRLGNGEFVDTKEKGTIAVQTNNGTKYISDVLLVPSLKSNLLSVGRMIEHGYIVHFEGDSGSIYDKTNKDHIVFKVKMENRNFHFIDSM